MEPIKSNEEQFVENLGFTTIHLWLHKVRLANSWPIYQRPPSFVNSSRHMYPVGTFFFSSKAKQIARKDVRKVHMTVSILSLFSLCLAIRQQFCYTDGLKRSVTIPSCTDSNSSGNTGKLQLLERSIMDIALVVLMYCNATKYSPNNNNNNNNSLFVPFKNVPLKLHGLRII